MKSFMRVATWTCLATLLAVLPLQAGQTVADDSRPVVRPVITGHGAVNKTLKADRLSVVLTLSGQAETIEATTARLQALRTAVMERAREVSVVIDKTSVNSLRIRRDRRNAGGFQGDMQLAVEMTNFDDPLAIVGKLATSQVTQVGNLSYGFSASLLNREDLCAEAIAAARADAEKLASSSGAKLGQVVHENCQDYSANRIKRFSAQDEATFSATATVAFSRVE